MAPWSVRLLLPLVLLLLLSTTCHCDVFDMPIKKCPAKDGQSRVADPLWLDGGGSSCDFTFQPPFKPPNSAAVELSNQYFYVAHVSSPYRNLFDYLSQRHLKVGKWSMDTRLGYMYVEQFEIRYSGESRNSTKISRMNMWDCFTSAVFLGDRHVLLTTNAIIGSKIGRILLVDAERFGFLGTTVVQLFPETDPPPPNTPTVIYGCHADSFTNDTLIAHNQPAQYFFTVCMYAKYAKDAKDPKMFLRSFNISIHTSNLDRDVLVRDVTYNFTNWTNPIEQEFLLWPTPNPTDLATFVAGLQTFPVHVIGKRTVLYRCWNSFTGFDGIAYWCWRNFEATEWGPEKPALTTAALHESVLRNGMFLGWSGSESPKFEPNSVRAYFLDRNSRRLYTLVVHDELHIVFTNVLTGMYENTKYTSALHFDLSPPKPMYFYGQVNHLYDFKWWLKDTMPVAVDEYMYLVGGGGYNGYCFYRQVLSLVGSRNFCVVVWYRLITISTFGLFAGFFAPRVFPARSATLRGPSRSQNATPSSTGRLSARTAGDASQVTMSTRIALTRCWMMLPARSAPGTKATVILG